MMAAMWLNDILSNAPHTKCLSYESGDIIVCKASGAAKNAFYLHCGAATVALETDGEVRFPPEQSALVCDWCVFTKIGLRGYFVELKGSDYSHAVEQLMSTMGYMQGRYGIVPSKAYVVISGTHPRNSLPGKANAKAKFKRRFANACLLERSCGDNHDVAE